MVSCEIFRRHEVCLQAAGLYLETSARCRKLNFKGNADTKFPASAGSVGDTAFATVVLRDNIKDTFISGC